ERQLPRSIPDPGRDQPMLWNVRSRVPAEAVDGRIVEDEVLVEVAGVGAVLLRIAVRVGDGHSPPRLAGVRLLPGQAQLRPARFVACGGDGPRGGPRGAVPERAFPPGVVGVDAEAAVTTAVAQQE